jgi:hypothetical protein
MTHETNDINGQLDAARESVRTHDELRRVEQIGDQLELGADERGRSVEWGVLGPSGRIWTFAITVLVARVPAVTGPDDEGDAWPWLDLDALAEAICAYDAHSAAWADYERRWPAPRDDDAYDRWQAAGPSTTPAASAVAVMSGSERTRLRLLATFSTLRVPLRASDLTWFDQAGQALLADWCEAVQAV